jgi:hypothetical protein
LRALSSSASERDGHTGSAKLACATIPSPKNVSRRCLVRSMNWSGITACLGGYSSLRLPTAEADSRASHPSILKPQMFAR